MTEAKKLKPWYVLLTEESAKKFGVELQDGRWVWPKGLQPIPYEGGLAILDESNEEYLVWKRERAKKKRASKGIKSIPAKEREIEQRAKTEHARVDARYAEELRKLDDRAAQWRGKVEERRDRRLATLAEKRLEWEKVVKR